jgi:hypothetical protein
MPSSIIERRCYVVLFQIRKVAQNLLTRGAARQIVENIRYSDPLATDAWAPAADLRVDCDAIETPVHVAQYLESPLFSKLSCPAAG